MEDSSALCSENQKEILLSLSMDPCQYANVKSYLLHPTYLYVCTFKQRSNTPHPCCDISSSNSHYYYSKDHEYCARDDRTDFAFSTLASGPSFRLLSTHCPNRSGQCSESDCSWRRGRALTRDRAKHLRVYDGDLFRNATNVGGSLVSGNGGGLGGIDRGWLSGCWRCSCTTDAYCRSFETFIYQSSVFASRLSRRHRLPAPAGAAAPGTRRSRCQRSVPNSKLNNVALLTYGGGRLCHRGRLWRHGG